MAFQATHILQLNLGERAGWREEARPIKVIVSCIPIPSEAERELPKAR